MKGLTFRLSDSATGEVILEQYIDDADLSPESARVAAGHAIARANQTGRAVVLDVYDADGDILPAGVWVELHRVDPQ